MKQKQTFTCVRTYRDRGLVEAKKKQKEKIIGQIITKWLIKSKPKQKNNTLFRKLVRIKLIYI